MAHTSKRRTASQPGSTSSSWPSKEDVATFAAALEVDLDDWQLTILTDVLKAIQPLKVARLACAVSSAQCATSSSGEFATTQQWETVLRGTSGHRRSRSSSRMQGYSPSLVIWDEMKGS